MILKVLVDKIVNLPLIKRIYPSLLRILNIKTQKKINNFYLNLELKNSIDREIYVKGIYENLQIKFLIEQANQIKFDHFFDIGSYLGYYSFFLEKNTNIKNIYAFEANPVNYNKLFSNKKLNSSNVNIYNFGCSSKNEKSKIWFTDSNKQGGSSVFSTKDKELNKYKNSKILFHDINLIKLDDKFKIKKEYILAKIDVERHELEVLKGATDLLLKNNFCLMQIEIFDDKKDEIFNFLNNFKFKLINNIDKDYYFKNY
mgnify:FL=1